MKKQPIKGYFPLIIVLCIAMILFCGCGNAASDSSDASATSAGSDKVSLPEIVIGCDNYPPFNYLGTDGQPTGIDVDLATEAFRRIGCKVKFSFINWEDKKSLLESGKIDCIWCCFSIDGRESDYRWAGPYMSSHQIIAVNKNSDIYTLHDLEGKSVAIQATTKPEEIFLNHDKYDNIPKLENLFAMQDRELLYPFLSKGYVDAVAAHETSVLQYMSDYNIEYRILDEPLLTVGLGAAFALDDERGLDEKLNKIFEQMYEDGTTKKIIGQYLESPEKYLEVYDDGK